MHLFLIALSLAAADPASWRFVSGSDNVALFVDVANVRRDGERVVFNEKLILSHPKSSADEFQSVLDANCIDFSFTARTTIALKGGKFIATRGSAEVEHAAPGSHRLFAIATACGAGRFDAIGGDPYAIATRFFATPPTQRGGAGDRGFRAAERLLAAAVAIGGDADKYSARVFSSAQVEKCEPVSCTYRRDYPVSLGAQTRVQVSFFVNEPEPSRAPCQQRPDPLRCSISAVISTSGDERAPRCVRTEPIQQAALAAGWVEHHALRPSGTAGTTYRWPRDPEIHLFVHPLADARCLRILRIARIPGVHPDLHR